MSDAPLTTTRQCCSSGMGTVMNSGNHESGGTAATTPVLPHR
jgi:hypothetical protein